MNVKEYIQSGIIESYVLGMADAGEKSELDQLRLQYPEIESAILAFEQELELHAIDNALPPQPGLKASLFNELGLNQADTNGDSIEIPKPAHLRVAGKTLVLRYIAAASMLLFMVSVGFNVYTYSKYKNLKVENAQLALSRNQLFANNTTIQTKFNELNKNIQLITGSDMVKVSLNGVPGKETNHAVVYWNKTSKDVYLIAKALPQAPEGKQYQLWALFDGKPIDAGVLGDCATVCKLKNIQNAQAFAITLENEGGSPVPNLKELYVMGNI